MNKVINFHRVNNREWFERVIILLNSKYRIIDVKELETAIYDKQLLKNTCHITIDDGDRSFYETIYPVLKKQNIPASLFVSPSACRNGENFWFQEIAGYNSEELKKIITEHLTIAPERITNYSAELILMNMRVNDIWEIIFKYQKKFNIHPKAPQNMSVEELTLVDIEGIVTIGAHTISHPILANEDNEKSESEIKCSFQDLEKILQHPIKYFAYPNGIPGIDFSEREIDFLNKSGCKVAFSTEPRNLTRIENPFAIPRFGFSYGNEYFLRAKLIMGQYWALAKNLNPDKGPKARIELKKLF